MRVLVPILLLCLCSVAAQELDPAAIAADLVDRHIPEAEWTAFVAKVHASSEHWLKEHEDGNLKWFLDDQIMSQGLGATRDVSHLKNFVMWVALYHTYDLPVPAKLRKLNEVDRVQYMADLRAIESNFSWDKALAVAQRRTAEAIGVKR